MILGTYFLLNNYFLQKHLNLLFFVRDLDYLFLLLTGLVFLAGVGEWTGNFLEDWNQYKYLIYL